MSELIPEPAISRESADVKRERLALRSAVEEPERDTVYESSLQSFPASDPPGWISMRLGPPAAVPTIKEAGK